MGRLIKFVVVMAGVAVLGILLAHTVIVFKFKATSDTPLYVITVPTYDGTDTTYFTKEYTEENGCVKFEDTFGFNKTICNNYTITEW